jgi:hypothetical protein
MKTMLRVGAAVATLALPLTCNAMLDWNGKTVAMLSSTYDGADCIYFMLDGVTEADPVKPGDPIFAIPRSQFGSKDGYAMLLSAKLTDRPVRVLTRGTLACGYAAVAQIMMF